MQFGGVIRSTVQAKLMIPFISVTKLIKKVEPDDVESCSTSDSVAGEEEIQETKQHNNPRPRKVRPTKSKAYLTVSGSVYIYNIGTLIHNTFYSFSLCVYSTYSLPALSLLLLPLDITICNTIFTHFTDWTVERTDIFHLLSN